MQPEAPVHYRQERSTMLQRLTALSADHFGVDPDEVSTILRLAGARDLGAQVVQRREVLGGEVMR